MTTAAGSRIVRAALSSSKVDLRTVPSTESTRTRTSAMCMCLPTRSDQFLGREVVRDLGRAVAVVLDHLAGLTRRSHLERDDLRARHGQPDLGRVDPEVTDRQRLDRL